MIHSLAIYFIVIGSMLLIGFIGFVLYDWFKIRGRSRD